MVRLLLDAGIGLKEFRELAQKAYVRAALDLNPECSSDISKISMLTGMSRAKIASILDTDADEPPTTERGVQRAERVLRGWWTDPHYRDRSGRPLILPLHGSRRSFAGLVKRYAGDPRVATLLDELIRVNAVRRRPDQRLEVLSRTFATEAWDPQGIHITGERVRDVLTTLVYNLKHPDEPRYTRFAFNSDVNPRYVPMLVRDLKQHVDRLTSSFEDALNHPDATIQSAGSAAEATRLGVAVFLIEEPAHVKPVADVIAKPVRRQRIA